MPNLNHMNRTPPTLAYSVNGAAAALQCGRSTVYKLLREGRLKSVPFGDGQRITAESVADVAANGYDPEGREYAA